MKITCEYCGCYVEADENNRCPCCTAPLGESIRAEEERLRKEAEEKAAQEKAAQEAAAESAAQAARTQAITSAITGIASTLGAAILNSSSGSSGTRPPADPPSGRRGVHRPPEHPGRPHAAGKRSGRHGSGGPSGRGGRHK
jgi:hypothetical protein